MAVHLPQIASDWIYGSDHRVHPTIEASMKRQKDNNRPPYTVYIAGGGFREADNEEEEQVVKNQMLQVATL